jgi:hypothetical protein
MPIAHSKPPVPPNTSLLFGHNATALLPHRASYRRNIRLRIGQRAYSDRLLEMCNRMRRKSLQRCLSFQSRLWALPMGRTCPLTRCPTNWASSRDCTELTDRRPLRSSWGFVKCRRSPGTVTLRSIREYGMLRPD